MVTSILFSTDGTTPKHLKLLSSLQARSFPNGEILQLLSQNEVYFMYCIYKRAGFKGISGIQVQVLQHQIQLSIYTAVLYNTTHSLFSGNSCHFHIRYIQKLSYKTNLNSKTKTKCLLLFITYSKLTGLGDKFYKAATSKYDHWNPVYDKLYKQRWLKCMKIKTFGTCLLCQVTSSTVSAQINCPAPAVAREVRAVITSTTHTVSFPKLHCLTQSLP